MLSPQQLISATSSALGFLIQQAFMGNQQFFQFTNDDFTLHVPLESLCRQFIGNYNKVADWMAKFGKGSYDEMHIFRVRPPLLRELLKSDFHLTINLTSCAVFDLLVRQAMS
ncbi:hypothetical protein ERO13_A03G211450v2 [Gossypium hirsutum]|nr:hypothetical protein ERO13_A03G211450v2 [Gossypium hirsutum]